MFASCTHQLNRKDYRDRLFMPPGYGHKKSAPDKSEALEYCKLPEQRDNLLQSLTYLPHTLARRDGISTIFLVVKPGKVAKASAGHDPLPFWISDVIKNWRKDITGKN